MKTWLDSDGAIINEYLRQFQFRPCTVATYRSVFVEFKRFVGENSWEQNISQGVLKRWLQVKAELHSTQAIVDRCRRVSRFLDWLVGRRLLASNPLAELENHFGAQGKAGIIRALLSPNTGAALESLRPISRFASRMGSVMRDHVTLMRSLGYRYKTQEACLLRFDRYLQKRPDLIGQPVRVLVQEWSKEDLSPQHLLECVQSGRILAKALQRIDPTVIAPKLQTRLARQVKQKHRRPYIYSEDEIVRLLSAAQSFPSPARPIRPLILYTMVVLAYCVGLRVGEIVRLTVGDINFDDQTIDIRETKFFKTRRLPVTRTVIKALRMYLEARHHEGAPSEPGTALFWQGRKSAGYNYVTVRELLVKVIRRAGLKPAAGWVGPRIHDLRHSFVVHRIVAWYREGINPQPRLPYLATYLGHKDINSLLVYVTITQELLQQAGERFRSFGAGVLQAAIGGDGCN